MMELRLEVIRFEADDIITSSGIVPFEIRKTGEYFTTWSEIAQESGAYPWDANLSDFVVFSFNEYGGMYTGQYPIEEPTAVYAWYRQLDQKWWTHGKTFDYYGRDFASLPTD